MFVFSFVAEFRNRLNYPVATYTLQVNKMPPHVLLTNEDRALLTKVSSLLEEIIETINVQENKETVKAIKQAGKEVKTGKTRNYNEFLAELKQTGE